MINSWLEGIINEGSPVHNKLIELLNDGGVVWEGLGPDGINSLAQSQHLDYDQLEEEYRDRIVAAFKKEDYLTMGKMFHFMLSSYVLAVAMHKDPDLDLENVQIKDPT
tara:strand:+ start:1513 stop:1836 length:324 start_codon:yes stop_codon:yes gene_type:complete